MKGAWLGIALGLMLFVVQQGMAVGEVEFPWAVAAIIGSRLAADIVAGVLAVCLLRTVLALGTMSCARARSVVSGMVATRSRAAAEAEPAEPAP